jgi:hypothetical protein
MSAALAIAAVAALFLILFAPLALVAWKAAGAMPVAAFYAVLLSITAGYQSGLFSRPVLPDLNVPEIATSTLTDAQCAEVLTLLDRAGAVIDRSRPPLLVVAQDRGSQLPEAGQQAVTECVQRSWPRGSEVQVEVRAQ